MQRLSAPLDVQMELTERCTQKCRHCYNYWRFTPETFEPELDLDDFLCAMSQIEAAKIGTVTFTGGEPMLRKDILFALIATAKEQGIETGLNSNGVLITENDATTMAQCGLDHALISVLGPEKVHNEIAGPGGSAKHTLEGIKFLVDADIPVAVNMVVSKLNLEEMLATATMVKRLGVTKFCAGPSLPSCHANIPLCLTATECKRCLTELMRVKEELSLQIDVLEPIPRCLFGPAEEQQYVRFFGNRICSAAVSSCVISASGQMRPCIHADIAFGSIFPNRFSECWEAMSSWAMPQILPEECRSCHALMLCEGGCRMSAKVTTGSYNGRDMYMTGPINDPQRAMLVSSDDLQSDLSETSLLRFNDNCIIRKEAAGYVVCLAGRVECLTDKGMCLLRCFQEGGASCVDLAERLGYSVKAVMLVAQRLVRAKILLLD